MAQSYTYKHIKATQYLFDVEKKTNKQRNEQLNKEAKKQQQRIKILLPIGVYSIISSGIERLTLCTKSWLELQSKLTFFCVFISLLLHLIIHILIFCFSFELMLSNSCQASEDILRNYVRSQRLSVLDTNIESLALNFKLVCHCSSELMRESNRFKHDVFRKE